MILRFETYLPLRDETEEIDSIGQKLCVELSKVSEKIRLPLDDFGDISLQIKVLKEDEIEHISKKYQKYFDKGYLDVIYFNSEIDFKEIYDFDKSNYPDYITNEQLNESMLMAIYRSRFMNFLIFTQLSVPGSLYSYKGFHLVNNEFKEDFHEMSSCLVGIGYEEKPSWPFIQTLPVDKVWNYILNKTKILSSDSSTNIERGLNAFSYLFDNNYSSANSLFWSMTGVEALYAEGEIGIGYQINNKAKLFLGEPKENKKVLTKLYDYRSKFLHGKKSIPLNHGWLDGEYTDNHDEEFMEKAFISGKLLAATLQEIINRDIDVFDFEFKLIQ